MKMILLHQNFFEFPINDLYSFFIATVSNTFYNVLVTDLTKGVHGESDDDDAFNLCVDGLVWIVTPPKHD